MDTLRLIFENFSKSLVSGILLSVGLMSIAYYLIWKKFNTRLKNRRIQLKHRVNRLQIHSELKNAVPVFIVGSLFSALVIYLSSKGYTRIYTDFRMHHVIWSICGFFILLIIDDCWFYWCHRLLHHPRLFPYIHVVHHRSIDVNPFTSMSFHWLEPFLLTLWIFPVAFILPVYAPILGAIQFWGLLDNIKSHLGYELYPAGLNRTWFRFLTSSTHHNMHHSKFKGNYGVHFRFWDWLFGTEFPDYEDEYEKIHHRVN